MDFPFDEERGEVSFAFTSNENMQGAPGFVHGGIIASLLDEAQGVLCFHIGHAVMTSDLHIKYHNATPAGEEIYFRCWLTAVRRRRLYTRATVHDRAGRLLVSSRAIWYALPERFMRRKFQDGFPEEESARISSILEANRRRAKAIRKKIRQEKGARR